MTKRFSTSLWGLFCLVLVGLCIYLVPRVHISSSVLELLPSNTLSTTSADLSKAFLSRLDRQVVWLIKTPDNSPTAAQDWVNRLSKHPFFSHLQGPMSEQDQQAWGKFFFTHRQSLVDDQTREKLTHPADYAQWVVSQVFSPFAGVGSAEIENDPLLLTRRSQLALQKSGQKFTLYHQWLTVTDEQGQRWFMLYGELKPSIQGLTQSQAVVDALNQEQQAWLKQYPNAQLLQRGSLFYSHYATQLAQSDIQKLGTLTILGVCLLIVLTFRSIRPLLLCAVSIGVGALGGTVATFLVFGGIHLITIAMSMSILGISVDYSIYFLTERMVHGRTSSPWQSLSKVKSSLLLALGTTATSYLLLLFAPFPGIQQLALFAGVGLACACLTVINFFPYLSKGLPQRPLPFESLMKAWLHAWQNKKIVYIGIPLLALIIAIVGISKLQMNDDIRSFQTMPEVLKKQDQRIAQLTGQSQDQTWFLITAPNVQTALERQENFLQALSKAKGAFDHFQSIPFYSEKRQRENQQRVQQATPAVFAALEKTGVHPKPQTPTTLATVNEWLASPVSQGWRLMLLQLPNQQTGILIPISGIHQEATLQALANQFTGVDWIHRAAQFNELFTFYRHVLTGLLIVVLCVVLISYQIRHGMKKGLICSLPTLLSFISALAALGLSGLPLNLFSLLALVLVLGIGINYSIFFSNPKGTPLTSLLAITLAFLTTLMTLGILVFSATQAIQGFGIVLCVGIFTAWLFSPLTLIIFKPKG